MAVARRKLKLPPIGLDALLESHKRALRAQNRSEHTIAGRHDAVTQLIAYCRTTGLPIVVSLVTEASIQDFLTAVQKKLSAATAQTRFDQLHAFFAWLVDDEELEEFDNPMRKIKRPFAPILEVETISDDESRRLIKTCDIKTFNGRRDAAILRMFLDMGGRVGGLASMRTDPTWLDLRDQEVKLILKGSDEHKAPFGAKTLRALDQYLRVRPGHPHSASSSLWLGQKGPLTESGICQMIQRRGKEAQVTLHSHMFRHTVCDYWLDSGGEEGDLVTLMGWNSRKPLERYAKKGRVRRAKKAHRRLGPGDHI